MTRRTVAINCIQHVYDNTAKCFCKMYVKYENLYCDREW